MGGTIGYVSKDPRRPYGGYSSGIDPQLLRRLHHDSIIYYGNTIVFENNVR